MEEGNARFVLIIPLGTIGIIVGTTLSILQGIGTIDIGWFWATFPFWVVPAIHMFVFLMSLAVAAIAYGLRD